MSQSKVGEEFSVGKNSLSVFFLSWIFFFVQKPSNWSCYYQIWVMNGRSDAVYWKHNNYIGSTWTISRIAGRRPWLLTFVNTTIAASTPKSKIQGPKISSLLITSPSINNIHALNFLTPIPTSPPTDKTAQRPSSLISLTYSSPAIWKPILEMVWMNLQEAAGRKWASTKWTGLQAEELLEWCTMGEFGLLGRGSPWKRFCKTKNIKIASWTFWSKWSIRISYKWKTTFSHRKINKNTWTWSWITILKISIKSSSAKSSHPYSSKSTLTRFYADWTISTFSLFLTGTLSPKTS